MSNHTQELLPRSWTTAGNPSTNDRTPPTFNLRGGQIPRTPPRPSVRQPPITTLNPEEEQAIKAVGQLEDAALQKLSLESIDKRVDLLKKRIILRDVEQEYEEFDSIRKCCSRCCSCGSTTRRENFALLITAIADALILFCIGFGVTAWVKEDTFNEKKTFNYWIYPTIGCGGLGLILLIIGDIIRCLTNKKPVLDKHVRGYLELAKELFIQTSQSHPIGSETHQQESDTHQQESETHQQESETHQQESQSHRQESESRRQESQSHRQESESRRQGQPSTSGTSQSNKRKLVGDNPSSTGYLQAKADEVVLLLDDHVVCQKPSDRTTLGAVLVSNLEPV